MNIERKMIFVKDDMISVPLLHFPTRNIITRTHIPFICFTFMFVMTSSQQWNFLVVLQSDKWKVILEECPLAYQTCRYCYENFRDKMYVCLRVWKGRPNLKCMWIFILMFHLLSLQYFRKLYISFKETFISLPKEKDNRNICHLWIAKYILH